jgi:hypothetical protein
MGTRPERRNMNYMYFGLYHQVRPRNEEMLQEVRTIRLEERLRANSERLATRLSTSSGEAQCHWYTRRSFAR